MQTSVAGTPLDADPRRPLLGLLAGFAAILFGGLLFYSQTRAFTWDEGFHLLAAQLIKAGKRPYLDFFHPQTPLYAYWNAAWMQIFGDTWRTAHALSALLTGGSAVLVADFVLARFAGTGWRLAVGLAAALFVGLNPMVVQYGTIGQPYGLCLFVITGAFRLAVLAVDRKGLVLPVGAGFLAGAGAASSLLTAPVGPVLLLWMSWHNRAGSRVAKFATFVGGGAVPFLPLLLLFAKSPGVVFFDAIQYHLFYRTVDWPDYTGWDIGVIISWLESSPAFLLGLLAAIGLVFIAIRSDWDRRKRAEFYLCGWMAAALCAYLAIPTPTFPRYFLLAVPFLGVLASVGLYAIGSRIGSPDRPMWFVLVLVVVLALGLAKSLYDARNRYRWHDFEKIGRKVDQVTPPQAPLWAEEQIYFVTRRLPPPGLEYADSHKLELPPARAASLHVLPKSELERWVAAGKFATVATCEDSDRVDELGLPRLYAQKEEIEECYVFWDKKSR